MKIKKLFFYAIAISIMELASGLCFASAEPVIAVGSVTILSDGTIEKGSSENSQDLIGAWGQSHRQLVKGLLEAQSAADRLDFIRANKVTLKGLRGVSPNLSNLIRPAVTPRRPRGGSQARAENPFNIQENLRKQGLYQNRSKRRVTFGNEAIDATHQEALDRQAAERLAADYKQEHDRRLAKNLSYKQMFDQSDELLDEEADADRAYREHGRDVERARLRAKIAEGRFRETVGEDRSNREEDKRRRKQKNAAYRAMFDAADTELERQALKDYSAAKANWWRDVAPTLKKKFLETEKKYYNRSYSVMLDDLRAQFPQEVAAEESIRSGEQ